MLRASLLPNSERSAWIACDELDWTHSGNKTDNKRKKTNHTHPILQCVFVANRRGQRFTSVTIRLNQKMQLFNRK